MSCVNRCLFLTTKGGAGGSGLGLNIVYNIITQQLRGDIECRSEPEEGTTFIVTLPNQKRS